MPKTPAAGNRRNPDYMVVGLWDHVSGVRNEFLMEHFLTGSLVRIPLR
jgi:hypothetical protein